MVIEDLVKVIPFSLELNDLISQLVVVRLKYVRFLKQLERKYVDFICQYNKLYNANSTLLFL